MKKIISIAAMALVAVGFFSSCNDEWTEELYSQMVSFKAPKGSNGVFDIYMRYNADGTGEYELPIIVSGTTTNSRDLDVKVEIDHDTLAILNSERFAVGRTDLWFKQLDDARAEFSPVCHIPAGSNSEVLDIKFNLKDLDLSEKWVLPLTIAESDKYVQNTRKGWYKALMNINLFNDWSGKYDAASLQIKVNGGKDNVSVENRTCRVVNDNTVFFYAGLVWEELEDRAKYKVNAEFGEPLREDGTSLYDENFTSIVNVEEGDYKGTLTLTASDPNNEANIVATKDCSYLLQIKKHATKPFLKQQIVTLYIGYSYDDITSDPDNPMSMVCEGTMTMMREYNTLIPDQDQAIQW